jgi:hypothetical protein
VAARPGDETGDPREVIEALTAAFIQGRLSMDEFDQRVGQALAAYAELDALTADIPATPSAVPSEAEPPQVTREAYNRGLVARGAISGAGGVMLLAMVVGTAVTHNPFIGFMLGGVLGAFMAVILGAVLTLILWVLESSDGRSPGRTPPPQARARAAERLTSAGQADVGQPRRDGRRTAEAVRDRRLSRGNDHENWLRPAAGSRRSAAGQLRPCGS